MCLLGKMCQIPCILMSLRGNKCQLQDQMCLILIHKATDIIMVIIMAIIMEEEVIIMVVVEVKDAVTTMGGAIAEEDAEKAST